MSDVTPLTPSHAAALLLASMETVRKEVDALPTEASSWHPAEGEWCVNEVIGHLIETEERGFGGRIERIQGKHRQQTDDAPDQSWPGCLFCHGHGWSLVWCHCTPLRLSTAGTVFARMMRSLNGECSSTY